MTVGELREVLERVDDDVQVRGSDGYEFSHVSIFRDTRPGRGEICLEVE